MAIIIPSKNIYEINNPKIRDNVVDNVSIGIKNVSLMNNTNTQVFINEYNSITRYGGRGEYDIHFDNANDKQYVVYAGYDISYKFSIEEIVIPRKINNGYVSNLLLRNFEGNNNISITLKGYLVKGVAVQDILFTNNSLKTGNAINYLENSREETTFELPSSEIKYEYNGAEVSISLPNYGNLIEATFYTDTLNDTFVVKNISFLCGVEKLAKMSAEASGIFDIEKDIEFTLVGDYESYETNSIEITINGNTTTLKLVDDTKKVGNGGKPFSLSGNELLQDNANTNGMLTTEVLANNILNEYRNGKETAVIRCSIGNYYDEEGNKVISIDEDSLPMTFSIGDIVIPMIYSVGGVDKPMSLYNGVAKTFCVVGRKPYYNGAVWQELTLQEV